MKIRDKAKQMEGLVQVLHGLDVMGHHVVLEVEKNAKTSPGGIPVHDCCQDDDQDGDQCGWDDEI